jgi:uncharacterized protein (DUF1330 family)
MPNSEPGCQLEGKTMPAYVLGIVRSVKDRRGLEEYWSRAGATFEGTGARPIAVYTSFKLLEGAGPVEGVVAIEFPDIEAAKNWYHGAGYQAVRKYREGAAEIELILVEGGVVSAPELRMPHIGR